MPRRLTQLSPLSLSLSTAQYSPIPLTSLSRRSATSRPATPPESGESSGDTTPSLRASTSADMASGARSKQRSAFQPYSHPHTVYDVESLASPRRLITRKVTGRRLKWLLAILAFGGMMLYVSDYGVPDVSSVVSGGSGGGGGWSSGQRPPKPDTDDIWDDAGDVEAIPPPSGTGGKTQEGTDADGGWVKNEHGDLFRRQPLPPIHPDLSLLPAPSTLFTEVGEISSFLKAPTYEPFPDSRLRDIISDPPADEQPRDASRYPQLPDDAYSRKWKRPDVWDGERGTVKKVQWEGFSTGRQDTWETKEETAVRHERRDAVRRGFVWAWQKYKDHAWGHDEVKPVSKMPSDPFNNWGASIIDTLDTLLVLGLNDEYNLCRPFVNQVNYHWVSGKDWKHGYVSPDPGAHPDDEGEPASEVWGVQRDKTVRISVFETTIRYLGGLLGAYDLSGDQLLVDRAVDLANVLKRAFETLSGLPVGHMEPGYESNYLSIGYLSIAEAASISLEFMRLSQVTGDRQWHDLAQRITDYLEERVIPRSTRGNLIPMSFSVDGTDQMGGTYVWGAMADSYYEYLPKTFKLLGNSKAAQQYRRIYEASADAAKQYLYYPVEIYDWSPAHKDASLLGIGKREATGQLIHEVEHLTCFAGAMLGLGAKLLDRSEDMVDAERFTETCYWLSASTPTGLQPEVVEFFQPGEEVWENVTEQGYSYLTPPPGASGLGEKIEERMKGSPTGSRKVVPRGINRPETIESIFYMYRLTGDRKWQEKGWKMFVSWVSAAKVDGGISSIHDVTQKDFYHSDNMESFMFAETLKYHFLLQSDPDVLSLDDYVLNTEAHPLIANPDIKPGSQRLWTPLPSQDLGTRGQGTDAQKWMRLDHLNRSQRPIGGRNANAPMAAGAGAGRGMGGGAYGGGRPDIKPQIPDEFKERFQNMKQNGARPRPA